MASPVACAESDDQIRFNKYLSELRSAGRIATEERISVLLWNVKSGERLLSVDPLAMRQSASMVKPFVALAFFSEVERGKIAYGPRSKKNLTRMLKKSNNHATNWFFQQLGGPDRVQAILDSRFPEISSGVSVVETIPANGRTYRNKASCESHARFMEALWKADLPYAAAMLQTMKTRQWLPGIGGVPAIYKNGFTARMCGEMKILLLGEKADRPYGFVGIIERDTRAEPYVPWRNNRLSLIREITSTALRLALPEYSKEKRQETTGAQASRQ